VPSNIFTFTPNEYSGAVIVFNLLLALFLALIIVFTYKKTHRGLSYSQSFFTTLVLICLISTGVIMVVQNNIFGALGLLGAFALIRFRTIVKETRDISFVFFSLSVGVAVGTGNYPIAIILTLFVCMVAYILWRFNIGSTIGGGYILSVSSRSPLAGTDFYGRFSENKLSIKLLNSRKNSEEGFEYTFSITVPNSESIDLYMAVLDNMSTILAYDIVMGREAEEY
jgi:uncharacterized membrane protein YhiD involved in acid resistance